MAPVAPAGNGYGHLDDTNDDSFLDEAAEASTPGGSTRASGWDRGQASLDDLAGFFQSAITELRNPHPVEAARKLRERVKEVTEVHIHRDKKKTAEIETIDYMPQDSEMYRKWLHTQPLQRLWDRWMMMFLVGFVVGACAFCLHVFFNTLAETKTNTMRYIIAKNVGLAWLFNVSYSLALVAISAASVLWVCPAAAGSGVPEVMAYLNGCHLPKMFEWKTSAIKFLSCACCVGAGLPVGPEGPMIFLGATLGGLVSQGTVNFSLMPPSKFRDTAELALSKTGGRLWPFKRFRNKCDQRDFMTAGCAAGVAGAFGAPIGGLLFAMEEVASFWNVTLGWQIFFACMTAVFARAFAESLYEGENPGLFSNTIAYEVTRTVNTHVLAMGVAVFIGAACGLTAALFTRVNLKWSQWRARYVGAVKWKRFAEPMVYMFVFSTIAMTLPFAFTCRESGCFTDAEGHIECSSNSSHVFLHTVVESTTETFICRSDIQDAFKGLPHFEESGDEPSVHKYNELATLMHVSGNQAIVHLMSRNTHLEFGFASICTFFVLYYFGAAIVAGSCISSGLFVPMLLMGACIGRFWGLVAVRIATGAGLTAEDLQSEEWAWIDPGVFAMVGAGAFMAGVSRLTLSLAVIVMEMTNEVHFLLPLLIAIMVAKWVADALEHALYHSLLEFKNVPFLPSEPFGGATLDMLSVRDIMCQGPVICLKETESLLTAVDILRKTKFHAFPVVRPTSEGDVFVGMITREHLTMILCHAALVQSGQTPMGLMSYEQLEGKVAVKGVKRTGESTEELELKVIGSTPAAASDDAARHANEPSGADAGVPAVDNVPGSADLDLRAYVNRSGVSVPHHFSAMRTFVMFRTLGLRHLPVVDEHNHVVGIVTRKELLDESLGEKLSALGIHVSSH